MKTKNKLSDILMILVVVIFVTSCGSDDTNTADPVEENKPPETFNLIAVADNEKNVAVRPTFSWEPANDPDRDALTYDIYLTDQIALLDHRNLSPYALYKENLNTVTFKATERLELSKDYYWRVIAKDEKGSSSASAIRSFSTRDLKLPNDPIIASAQFSERRDFTSVVFNDKIWVIGGRNDNLENVNDVWYSENGENWTEATTNAQFSARRGHTSIVFDSKIWIIGGYDNNSQYLNDVWYSADGINWTEASASAQFSGRRNHTSVVFNDKMWVIGGDRGASRFNDVWQSEDGVAWNQVTASAQFSSRNNHTVVVFDDKLWVIGGHDGNNYKNDVWQSEDGVVWNQVATGSLFNERVGHTSVIFDDKIWVVGGVAPGGLFNDIWYTSSGNVWKQVKNNVSFSKRYYHTSIVFKEKIWLIAGYDGSFLNDVWALE
ncbi:Kelch repeat-containing protein [Aquimarina algiphila]|uniref:Kelch repeat-containing protein n=1 Tax=Aquimarina algiphila TaxID=2047982 RepID=UPI0024922724|nr:kelch repeat-containing protein [Aquimarina algiphila]